MESPLTEPDAPEPEDDDEDADVEEDYHAPKPKPKAKQATDKPPPRKRGPQAAKRPKTAKATTGAASKPKKATGARRGRKPAAGVTFDAEQVAKDTKISNDNSLFSAYVLRVVMTRFIYASYRRDNEPIGRVAVDRGGLP